MSKENQKPSLTDEVPANEFAVTLLKKLQWIEPKRLLEVRFFFSQAFLLHTEDDIFEEREYRVEWANNVNYIHELCCCVEKYTAEQIDNAIDHSIAILKKEKEVRHD